jgi:RES domain-containing protein
VLSPRWAHEPLSGAGAALYGGRWNPKGVPALYMSAEFTTAVAEYQQDLGARPGTFCAYDVVADDVLDLRDAAVLAVHAIDPAERFCAWKAILLIHHRRPPTWDVADRLMSAGAAGVLVPSDRVKRGTNLVLWRWNDRPDRTVTALDPMRDLPDSPTE